MIGYLEGTVILSEQNKILLHTSFGLGFEVFTTKTYDLDQKIALFSAQIFKEDSQLLFGFETIDEKKLFEQLISVNGIGPKTAFNIIAQLGSTQVIQAITIEDSDSLKKVSGLGKKGAEQIILSLKDKIHKFNLMTSQKTKEALKNMDGSNFSMEVFTEALEACHGLGFKDQDVVPMLKKLLQENAYKDSQALMMSLLKEMR